MCEFPGSEESVPDLLIGVGQHADVEAERIGGTSC